MATSVLAEESSKVSKDYVVDNADLLTQTEENELSEKLQDISDELQFDVVVVTTNSTGSKTATEYADDYFDYNGYGRGSIIMTAPYSLWISVTESGLFQHQDMASKQLLILP